MRRRARMASSRRSGARALHPFLGTLLTSPVMRICVAARRDPTHDPHTRALVYSLADAGHEVTVIAGRGIDGTMPGPVPVRTVSPPSRGVVGRIARRLTGSRSPGDHDRAVQDLVAGLRPDLIYPVRDDDVDLADRSNAMVLRRPAAAPAGKRDLLTRAPHDVRWSSSPAGEPVPLHLTRPDGAGTTPEPNRHAGVTVAVAGRLTPTNPSRYIIAALERSGATVVRLDGAIDWAAVPDHAAAVLVVEGPYPALPVVGDRRDVPVLFWVHHGEHHLAANLRLVDRYGTDAVLLAHSWHLAHRFPVPVHRFPFAVAPDIHRSSPGFADRTHDVAMVAAGLITPSVRYGRRYEMARRLQAAFPDRTAFRYGLRPYEMAALYGDSRIVLNDGGTRHLPITMRVFEALGAGALLVTEDLPGMDVLLEPGTHYVTLGGDAVAGVRDALARPDAGQIAAAGHSHAMAHHTYDHRIDDLLRIAAATTRSDRVRPTVPSDPLSAAVHGDVDVHTVAVFGAELDLPDRAVRSGAAAEERLPDGRSDAVVLGAGAVPDLDVAVTAARRYVYTANRSAPPVLAAVERVHPDAQVGWVGPVMRVDLGAPGYRMRPDDHPLAS
jgi:hypothetical protein